MLAFSKSGCLGSVAVREGFLEEVGLSKLLVWVLGGPGAAAVLRESLAPPEVPQAEQGGLTETVPCCL